MLLVDGRLIRGVITHDESTYSVEQKVGVIRYPTRLVERAFDSVEEAYQYRLERVPEDDPAERLRLARWCMSLHLDKEARMLLEQVVEISPDHGPARAMLTKIAQSEATRIARSETKVDEGVKQTGGEEIAEDRPGALDSAVLRGAEQRMGITGLPVIFDLPQAMAVRRAEQFKQYVHPVLQAYCAKCHNAEYEGTFQLVPVKTSRQRTPDAVRANLDTTLRFVDRQNPEKSELLSSTLRPHGAGGKGRPIFSGSNDRAYRILATWVTSLRPQGGADPVAVRRPSETGEAFAADRERPQAGTLDEFARRAQAGDPRQPTTMKGPGTAPDGPRSYRYVEGQGMVPEESRQADPREFPLPPMLGGPLPTVPGSAGTSGDGRSQAPRTKVTVPSGSPTSTRTGRGDRAAEVDGIAPTSPATPGSREGAAPGAPAARKNPVKIDPKILEKFLQRNANRPDGQ